MALNVQIPTREVGPVYWVGNFGKKEVTLCLLGECRQKWTITPEDVLFHGRKMYLSTLLVSNTHHPLRQSLDHPADAPPITLFQGDSIIQVFEPLDLGLEVKTA